MVVVTAVAGAVGGDGLDNFGIVYGYQRFNRTVTWVAVLTVVVLVQGAQFPGKRLARRALRRGWGRHNRPIR